MSKGPGRVMRAISKRLKKEPKGRWFDAATIASMLYKGPTRSQKMKVRNALRAMTFRGYTLERKSAKATEWMFFKDVRARKAKPEVLPLLPMPGGGLNTPWGGLTLPHKKYENYKQPEATLVIESPPTQPDQPAAVSEKEAT